MLSRCCVAPWVHGWGEVCLHEISHGDRVKEGSRCVVLHVDALRWRGLDEYEAGFTCRLQGTNDTRVLRCCMCY